MIPEPIGHHALPLRGSLFTIFLCMLFGANAVALKISLTGLSVFTNVGMGFGIAALVIFLWARCTGKPLVVRANQVHKLVTAAIGFVAWNTMIQKFGATAPHSFVFIMPISGVFLGVTLLGKPITLNLICAIAIVVTGLIVVNKVSRKRLPRMYT